MNPNIMTRLYRYGSYKPRQLEHVLFSNIQRLRSWGGSGNLEWWEGAGVGGEDGGG